MKTRRELLRFLGGSTAISLAGCWRGPSASSEPAMVSAQATQSPTCIVRPEQTEGPYFTDERLNRADIRSDSSNGSVKPGVPLQLAFQVSQIRDRLCTPLENAIVDVWHCDAEGIYSDVEDPRFNTIGQKFLRGYQVTDGNGMAQFTTIYPGWYRGRAVHIHFKVRTQGRSQPTYEFTSQLYFDDRLTDQVFTQAPYQIGDQRTLNASDRIFQRGGEQLILPLTRTTNGYAGTFALGLEGV